MATASCCSRTVPMHSRRTAPPDGDPTGAIRAPVVLAAAAGTARPAAAADRKHTSARDRHRRRPMHLLGLGQKQDCPPARHTADPRPGSPASPSRRTEADRHGQSLPCRRGHRHERALAGQRHCRDYLHRCRIGSGIETQGLATGQTASDHGSLPTVTGDPVPGRVDPGGIDPRNAVALDAYDDTIACRINRQARRKRQWVEHLAGPVTRLNADYKTRAPRSYSLELRRGPGRQCGSERHNGSPPKLVLQGFGRTVTSIWVAYRDGAFGPLEEVADAEPAETCTAFVEEELRQFIETVCWPGVGRGLGCRGIPRDAVYHTPWTRRNRSDDPWELARAGVPAGRFGTARGRHYAARMLLWTCAGSGRW